MVLGLRSCSVAPTSPLILSFQGQAPYELAPNEMHPGVLKARTAMYDDWVRRWITNLTAEVKRTYAIASLLHPCFKAYDFVDGLALIPAGDKAWALRELRTEWATVWKLSQPFPASAPLPPPPPPAPLAPQPPTRLPTLMLARVAWWRGRRCSCLTRRRGHRASDEAPQGVAQRPSRWACDQGGYGCSAAGGE